MSDPTSDENQEYQIPTFKDYLAARDDDGTEENGTEENGTEETLDTSEDDNEFTSTGEETNV